MIGREIDIVELFTKRNDRIRVVTQEVSTGRILGLNLTNQAAFIRSIRSGKSYYFDEVNEVEYLKGEHSGEVETIEEIRLDCCHARRHEFHLLYRVEMEEGRCKFGISDCHFYVFRDGRFVFDSGLVMDEKAVISYRERIETLMDKDSDRKHQREFRTG